MLLELLQYAFRAASSQLQHASADHRARRETAQAARMVASNLQDASCSQQPPGEHAAHWPSWTGRVGLLIGWIGTDCTQGPTACTITVCSFTTQQHCCTLCSAHQHNHKEHTCLHKTACLRPPQAAAPLQQDRARRTPSPQPDLMTVVSLGAHHAARGHGRARPLRARCLKGGRVAARLTRGRALLPMTRV